MTSAVGRGLAAGAVGTTVLNAITYADMAWRGRDASSSPEDLVVAVAKSAGTDVPGKGRERSNRVTALGALSGSLVGVGIGVAVSVARRAGLRFSAPVGAVVTGAAAMAASDLPLGAFGVSDPRTWATADWVADAVPHLAYGAATHGVIRALEPSDEPVTRASASLVARSALLGVATGGRSSLGLSMPVMTSRASALRPDAGAGPVAKVAAGIPVVAELVADKAPATPSRLTAQGLPLRFAAAAGGAASLAGRERANAVVPVVAGAAGAAAGSWGGAAWRAWALQRMPDWRAALIEDGASVALAAWACLAGRPPAPVARLGVPATALR